ncbi:MULTISPECIES: carbohydrate ABC transporter permease [Thermoanaerobacterium]|uniref:ABC transporter n=2 Tax=Thermoanaerobacterium TaxID=28895 RepID=W9E9S7_9THEO|nr:MULTISPECIES: carbohydrate ABC transporter permease [Thermoanaerobacterium]AFK85521.1 ABC-type transporter, integral membrane subunit [Thermoanaerobacterium saccharolyticum JW/SL-YS485]ETO37836.1 ABC transporter [Thermoanaerobacterium aotearoense SCUT27]
MNIDILKKDIKMILLIVLALIFLIPIIWVVISSFKNNTDLYKWPPDIFPKTITFNSYTVAFEKGNFGLFFFNSTTVSILSTIITIIINTMAGYAFAKYKFKGDNVIFLIFISTLIIPLEVIMIPIFSVIRKLGLYNNLLGIIIPPAATPTGVFLVRQYLLNVPDELIEAARIDGANEWSIFWKLIFPISMPVVSVLAIFSFMWRWNDFLWPLIVISDPSKYTIQLAISNFIGEFNIDWNSLLAMSVITMIPVLIIFIIFQKQFVSGMVTSGLKD